MLVLLQGVLEVLQNPRRDVYPMPMTTPDTLASLIAKMPHTDSNGLGCDPRMQFHCPERCERCSLEASHEEIRRQFDSKAVDVLLAENRILKNWCRKSSEDWPSSISHPKLEAALDALAEKLERKAIASREEADRIRRTVKCGDLCRNKLLRSRRSVGSTRGRTARERRGSHS